MNIVLIHGQSHEQTSCRTARLFAAKLGEQARIAEFFLPKDMPEFCKGCYTCLRQGEEHCPHYKYLKPVTQAIDNADLLVFSTPVYCMRTTGAMKAFLDHYFTRWITHRPKEAMYFKRAVIISSGAGAGMKKAAADIKTSLFNWGISDITVYGLRSMSTSWEGVDEKVKLKVKQDMAGLAKKLKNTNRPPRVSLRSKFMFMAMRMMQKKGAACLEDTAYWAEKGWLLKNRPWRIK